MDSYHLPYNDLQIAVDAHATYTARSGAFPASAWGTVWAQHRFYVPGGLHSTSWKQLKVDCLTTGGPTATVTGIVVRTSPDLHDQLGKREGVSFYVNGRHSRVGSSVPPATGPLLPKCMAISATWPVKHGGFTLKDAPLVPPPIPGH